MPELCDRLHFGLLVDGDHGDLAVVALELERRLVAVRGLAPHLDPADRPPAFAHDDAFDLGQPAAMAHAHVLGHADSRPGRILRLGRRGDHAFLTLGW